MDPFMNLLASGWYYYLVVGLQVFCVIHVLRTGRELYWIFIIFFLPVIGALIYLYMHGRGSLSALTPSLRIKIPMLELLNERAIESDYRDHPSLDNKIRYSELLLKRQRYEEARSILSDELQGPLRNNVSLLFAYARICFVLEDYWRTLEILDTASKVPNSDRLKQRHLLRAMAYERVDDAENADLFFREAQGGFIGEEAKVRYGLFLAKAGRIEEAKQRFQKVIDSCRISSREYQREQRHWQRMSADELARLQAPAESAAR